MDLGRAEHHLKSFIRSLLKCTLLFIFVVTSIRTINVGLNCPFMIGLNQNSVSPCCPCQDTTEVLD